MQVLWLNTLFGSNPKGLKNWTFLPTEDCQNLRYEKSNYCWSQINRNYQSCYIEHKIVTKRNQYFLTLNKWILMNILEVDNHPLSAILLHPRKQKVELLYIFNHATVIRLSYLRFIELLVAWEKSLIFSAPGDLKLIATLNTKPTNLSHIESELQNDTWTIRIHFVVKETASILRREFWVRLKDLCIHL